MTSLTPKTVFYDNGDRFVGNYRSDTNKAEGHGEFVYAAGGEYKGDPALAHGAPCLFVH